MCFTKVQYSGSIREGMRKELVSPMDLAPTLAAIAGLIAAAQSA